MNMTGAPCWDLLLPWHPKDSRDCLPFPMAFEPRQKLGPLG